MFRVLAAVIVLAATASPAEEPERPFGIAVRAPWTTSRIVGSPDPPSPYVAERCYAQLTFQQPVAMVAFPEQSRICVVERNGQIYSFVDAANIATPDLFLAGAAEVDGLKAIYGLAFHPDFPQNRYCYLCYILGPNIDNGTRVSRFRVTASDPPRIDPETETVLLTWRSGGHNGGCLQFGPDGYLYISTGDGSPPAPPDIHDTGQDCSDLLASLLRIDVDRTDGDKPYAIPPDNPFVNAPAARPEIWAFGLRNPWRMSFDRKSGELWLGDVGWQLWEMVYRISRGGNYGWSIKEGPQSVRPDMPLGPAPITAPVIAHPRADAASVTGGYVHYGNRLPELNGAYIYGDYVTGKIWSLRYNGNQITEHRELTDTSLAIISFYEGPQGDLAFMDYSGGGIYRLVPNSAARQTAPPFPKRLSETGLFADVAKHQVAAGVVPFSINAEQWMDRATAERYVAVPGHQTIALTQPKGRVPLQWGKFPSDTVLAKTISMETEPGNPASRRRLETQVLHYRGDAWRDNSGEWHGYTYVWNAEQTDATLAPREGGKIELSIVDQNAPGGRRTQTWHVASRAECYLCHNPWAGYRLAFTVPQLNRDHDYGQRADNQLRTLRHIAILDLPQGVDEESLASVDLQQTLVSPHDDGAELHARARAYLHVNCAHCHRFGGGGTAAIDLRFSATLEQMQAVDVRPTQGTFEIPRPGIVAAGRPYHSVLLYRMAKLGRGRMPYIGSSVVDVRGLDLIETWIHELNPDADGAVQGGRLDSTPAALATAREMDAGRLAAPAAQAMIEAGARHENPVIRDLFERFLPEDQRVARLGAVVNAQQVLTLAGNAADGQKLYFADGMQCQKCHRIGQQGGRVGPNLIDIGKKRTVEQLFESIVEPSKTIQPQFATFLVETVDGRVLNGIITKRSQDSVTLRDAHDKIVQIEVDQIEFMAPQARSMMPELLFRDLTAQQLADLIAYLKSL